MSNPFAMQFYVLKKRPNVVHTPLSSAWTSSRKRWLTASWTKKESWSTELYRVSLVYASSSYSTISHHTCSLSLSLSLSLISNFYSLSYSAFLVLIRIFLISSLSVQTSLTFFNKALFHFVLASFPSFSH